jgi:hypothetical protein
MFQSYSFKGIAYFDLMESYMVKSEDGTFYLWENQHDLLYELGNSRDQVKSTLALDNWDGVKASDPRGYRQQRQLCQDEWIWQHIWYILSLSYSFYYLPV